MDTPRRLTEQGRERKQQLLDQAADLFSRRGYADTRVVDICEAAGVAKGLFYWYFENKEALFAELVTSMRLRLRRAQSDAMDPTADPLVRLRQGAEASLRFMAGHAPFFSLLEVENRDQTWTELLRQGTEVHAHDVAALIREGIDLGLVRDDDPTLMAYGVVGVVSTYSHFQRTGRLGRDARRDRRRRRAVRGAQPCRRRRDRPACRAPDGARARGWCSRVVGGAVRRRVGAARIVERSEQERVEAKLRTATRSYG